MVTGERSGRRITVLTVEALLCEEARLWKESSVDMDERRCEFAEWKEDWLSGDDIDSFVVFEFSRLFCMPSYMSGVEYPITMYPLLYIGLMSLDPLDLMR